MLVICFEQHRSLNSYDEQFPKTDIMSLLSGHQVAVQSVHIPDINTSLTNVPLTQSSKPEKVSDAGTGSKAPKILQYGSRHTIQNTGWTTKLACDPSPKRNVAPSLHKLPVPPVLQDSVKPFYPSMPLLSINRPTVLKLQSSVPLAAKTDIAIQVVGSQTTASSIAQCTVTSSSLLPTIQAQPGAGVLYTPGMNHAVLTMPTFNTRAPGKPPTVCFMPISPMMCGPVAGLPSKVPGLLAVSQAPTGVVRIPQVSLASLPLITQSCSATESKTVMSKAATKSASSASLPSAKRLLTWTSDSQKVDARMLTVKLHIEDGHITDVQEMLQQLHEPETNHVMLAMVSGAAVASNVCMSHVDANGAQFGYHDLMDGTRVRIATDTSGQRHAPFFLLPGHNGPCHFEDSSVELMTASSQAPEHVPDEADVSEVGTTFTFEPLYVSEQTLVPIPRRKLRPPQDCNEDESEYCYRCYLCSFVSDDHVEVCKHWVNSHLKELPYCCPYCDRTFFTSTKAQVHVQRQHKDRGLTTVGFQRSNYFANTLSYDIEDADVDEDSSSGETEEQEIVFEHWLQQRLQRSRSDFRCRKCCFKAKSFVEMRRHVKFIHGQSQFGHGLSKAGRQVETNNMQVNGGSRYLQAEIAWSNISEKLLIGGEVRFQCRWCLFWAESASAISLHVLRKHQWPEAVLCPSCLCSLQLSDADRSSTSVACSSCGATILLTASTDRSASSPEVRDRVFVCNVCAFKTQERDRMCRHIKYNHTKTRPYTCVYCNYVAVERSQVKMHIANHHPDQDVIIKERSDPLEHILSNLFPKLVSVQTSKTNTVLPNEVTDDDDGSGEPVPSSGVDGPLFNCEECKLQTLSLEQLIRHQHQFHKSTVVANMSMMPAEPETISPASEHFKCVICDYCCLDRSCMSRHVKYMHITARPHSCMYCSYNNVEKTKVRLHIMAHHPGRQKTVHTDRKILEEMSWQAKHLYVRIDATGLWNYFRFNLSN